MHDQEERKGEGMISVVIPMYNAKAYVCEAVASVLAQDVEKELILVDDASTDRAAEAVREFLAAHPAEVGDTKVRILVNPRNLGVAASRNRGVKEASGEYIAYLDADDRFAPGKLAKQLAVMESSDACLCNTARILIRQDGSRTNTVIHTPEKITLAMLERTNCINCSSVMAKRRVLLAYPMEHSELHEDYLTWLRMLSNYPYAVGIDEPLLEYRMTQGGKSANKLKSAGMTYRTYRAAGYGSWKSARMLVQYMLHGIRKYTGL